MTSEKIHGSLFSGVGGWSLASDQMGWSTAFMCEWDENKQYVLKHHWPNAEIYGDITTTDFTIWRGEIYILSASTPCQPYSVAGKRGGANDVRHLWPETIRAIREIQPSWFVLENVPGLVNWSEGMVFREIITDLENEGYEVLPFLLPACGVNAPHKRERIWIIAYSNKAIFSSLPIQQRGQNEAENVNINRENESRAIANSSKQRQQDWQSDNGRTDSKENRTGMDDRPERPGCFRTFADTDKLNGDSSGLCSGEEPQLKEAEILGGPTSDPGSQGCKGDKQHRFHEQKIEKRGAGIPRTASELHSCTNWFDFPTVWPVRIGDDGFSRDSLRLFINENSGGLLTEKEVDQIIQKSLSKWNNETIASGGDAVVPGLVLQIFKAINEYANLYEKTFSS